MTMNELLQPLTDSVEEITTKGVPIKVEITPMSAFLLALALVIPIMVFFGMKKITK